MTTTSLTSRLDPQFAEEPQENNLLLSVMDKLANNPNIDADKMERLMDVFIEGQRKMATMHDERAFAEAMADFKKNPPEIVKRKKAKMHGIAKGSGKEYQMEYNFADLDEYTRAAMPALAERGITWSFPFSENEKGVITVSCILRYGLYQHPPTTLSSPPETSGTKNDLQAKGSALSYLERYTFCGATGLTAAMPDTDGRLTPAQAEQVRPAVTEKQEAELQDYADALRQCPDLQQLKTVFADAYKFAGSVNAQEKEKMGRVYEDCKRRFLK